MADTKNNTPRARILELLDGTPGMTPTEMARATGATVTATKKMAWLMGKEGTLTVTDGRYRINPATGGAVIERKDTNDMATNQTPQERLNALDFEARNLPQWLSEAAATLNTDELIRLRERQGRLPVLRHVARIELLREEAATLAAEDDDGKAELAALAAELAEVETALKPLQETHRRVMEDVRAVQDDQRYRAARLREIPRQVDDLMNQIQGNAPMVEPITYGFITAEQVAVMDAARAKKAAYVRPEDEAYRAMAAEAEARGADARARGEVLELGIAPNDHKIRPFRQPQPDTAPVGVSIDGALVFTGATTKDEGDA